MTGVRKPSPLEAFQDNMRDAHHLVALADGLTNTRVYRMRKELRARIGEALRMTLREQEELDCLESPDMFLTFKAGPRLSRASFDDHRPLLRQALVAACAATETYLADKVMARMGDLTTSVDAATDRLKRLDLTVGDWLYIEENYTRRRVGLHRLIIERRVRESASTAASKVGELLSLAGIADPQKQLDKQRGVAKGATYAMLNHVTERRNKIVHTGDRLGRSRAALTITEAETALTDLESVVAAIEVLL